MRHFCLTMDANGTQADSGQSVLEFLLMAPVMIALVVVLIRVNMAMQSSIVNQQYARAHTHWLAFNSAFYPEHRQRDPNFTQKGYNRMVIGVGENVISEMEGPSFHPEAPTQVVVRRWDKSMGDGPAQQEPDERAKVRIRNTITLCTQSNVMVGGGAGKADPITPDRLIAAGDAQGQTSKMFLYCRSPLDE